jgi:imidazolonepropionase-like amidohydrolase
MTIVLRGATLIDGTGADPRRDSTLVMDGDQITAVGNGGAAPPGGASVVDIGGRTVMPGLFDCHVHLELDAGASPLVSLAAEAPEETARAAGRRAVDMLRRGITTVRDCGARGPGVIRLRDAIAAGRTEGPHILACGRAIGARGGHAGVLCDPVETERQAAAAARRQLAAGADFIKVMVTGGFGKDGEQLDHCELTPAQIRAAAAVAHGAGKRLTAHAYGTQGILNAIAGEADSVEHAAFLDAETIGLLRERGIFIVPTLTNTYRVSTEGRRGGVMEYLVATAAAAFPAMLASAGRAHRAGVSMAIGTDAGSWLNRHADVATELRLRVEAGASPLAALTMATRDSARCLGIGGTVGTLRPGQRADVIVVNGDPLADLSALERIHSVYKAGRLVGTTGAGKEGHDVHAG